MLSFVATSDKTAPLPTKDGISRCIKKIVIHGILICVTNNVRTFACIYDHQIFSKKRGRLFTKRLLVNNLKLDVSVSYKSRKIPHVNESNLNVHNKIDRIKSY